MATISLCMIVKNEEDRIEDCLKSTFGIPIDEYIIVNTGSIDKTVEILENMEINNLKIFDFEWRDDFAAARNFSFSKATSDFIFWIDADDIIPDETCKVIKEYIENPQDADYLMLPYHYSSDEYGTCVLTLKRERVLRRSKNPVWYDPIHEYIDLVSMVPKYSNVPIIHKRDRADAEKDGLRNLEIYEKSIKENHPMVQTARFKIYYASALESGGRDIEAVTQYTRFLKESGPCDERIQAMCSIARVYLNKGMTEQARKICYEIIETDDRFAEPFYYIGLSYVMQNQFASAIKFLKCAEIMNPPEVYIPIIIADYSINPKAKLCLCYWNCNNKEMAMHYCIECLRLRPRDNGLHTDYKNLYSDLKKDNSIAYIFPPELDVSILDWSSFRNRRFRVANYLKAYTNYRIIMAKDYCDALEQCPEYIVWTHFGNDVIELMKLAKEAGIINIYDSTEALFEFPWFVPCLKLMDHIFCSSVKLMEMMKENGVEKISLFSDPLEENILGVV